MDTSSMPKEGFMYYCFFSLWCFGFSYLHLSHS